MKLHSLLTLAASLCLTGCNTAKTISALSKDNAAFHGNIRTIYGTVDMTRVMPPTNAITTIKPDGTITIERQ